MGELALVIATCFGSAPVRFVQVGSNDGRYNDRIFPFSSSRADWSGLLVEPVPYLFERLKRNYAEVAGDPARFRFAQVAVSGRSGTAQFHYVSPDARNAIPDLRASHDKIGSLVRGHVLKHRDGLYAAHIETIEVETLTLHDLLDRHDWHGVDLVHIDAEGADWDILSATDLGRLGARLLIYEHKHLSEGDREAARAKLDASGYRLVELINDTCAIRKDRS